ncbi:MAG TPA: hypothetical protein VM489_16690 [Burkholderiales bacterium]|jgi:hypothetical protein|nr:hypothetical protein [Burkholderiales bacterium]
MLADYQTIVSELVRDDGGKISPAERDRAIAAAVMRYSKDRPRTKVEDVTPESSQLLPLPASWEAGFSDVVALEHPKGRVPPVHLKPERVALYSDPAGTKIMLLDHVAVATDSVRASFTVAHQVDAQIDTVPAADREAVACWAAASLCDQLAAFYSSGTDSTIQADAVDGRSKAQEYSARAKTLRVRYHNELGIDFKKAAPAGAVVNLDFPDSRGQDRLTHPARYR